MDSYYVTTLDVFGFGSDGNLTHLHHPQKQDPGFTMDVKLLVKFGVEELDDSTSDLVAELTESKARLLKAGKIHLSKRTLQRRQPQTKPGHRNGYHRYAAHPTHSNGEINGHAGRPSHLRNGYHQKHESPQQHPPRPVPAASVPPPDAAALPNPDAFVEHILASGRYQWRFPTLARPKDRKLC